MGHAQFLAAVCTSGLDQGQQNFFDHISSFWSVVLIDHHVLWNGGVSELQMQTPM